MSEEKTVYVSSAAKPARLICCWKREVHSFRLDGEQSLGRATKNSSSALSIPIRTVSRNHGEFLTTEVSSRYRDVGSSNGTIYNGEKIPANTFFDLHDGDVLRIHGSEDLANESDVLMVYTTNYHDDVTWRTQALHEDIAEISVGREETIALGDRSVSRHHASFFRATGGWCILDHGSLNGVYVNSQRITGSTYLKPMDVIRIAGYLFFYIGDELLYQANEKAADEQKAEKKWETHGEPALSIFIEERNVWHRMKKKTLLKDIKLEIPDGSMTLILGGSGAGKTTFMNAVMGYEPAQGAIRYKDTDIYAEYKKMKYEIGYVPQENLLRKKDTVYDTLLNAAQMRLPSSLSTDEYRTQVQRTMRALGLEREQFSLVEKLSGGQQKRLSVAVEYIGNPSLFFLDEPDSGLDGTMARALMENLRAIADEGKIVIVISHSPDRAFELFDQVIVLAKSDKDNSGHLVFCGSPKSACAFFQVDCLEKIVKRINRPDEGGDGMADYYIDRFARQERDT